MNTGIGASGAARGDRLAGELSERRFKPVLHRAAAALALPALIGLAAIADAKRNALPALERVRSDRCVGVQSIEARKR